MVFAALVITMLSPPPEAPRFVQARTQMVDEHLRRRDIRNPLVLKAMGTVRRHALVRPADREFAYRDNPMPIGHRQTISQPYVVALMTQLAQVRPGMKVLDVGTGSGYQAAVLAEIVEKVYSIEIVCPLADLARDRLKALGYANVTVRCGDGWKGWPEHAPFDAIVLAAAPAEVPPALVKQLKPGGRLVLPVGGGDVQSLVVMHKKPDGTVVREGGLPVRFVPMTGGAQGAVQP